MREFNILFKNKIIIHFHYGGRSFAFVVQVALVKVDEGKFKIEEGISFEQCFKARVIRE